MRIHLAAAVLLSPAFATLASAQVPVEGRGPAKPNVMLLLDGSRTTLISQRCASCHAFDSSACAADPNSCSIYADGLTRLSSIRRALTGGWGWNTSHTGSNSDPSVDGPSTYGKPADARTARDGIMDLYAARWGVMWYDGLGVRIASDLTEDSEAAQKAVIDFGQPPNDQLYGVLGSVTLNSFVPWYGTVEVTSYESTYPSSNPRTRAPWAGDVLAAGEGKSKQSMALSAVRDYFAAGASPALYTPSTYAAPYFGPSPPAADCTVVDADPAASCRRSVTIMLQDGHGGDPWDPDGTGPLLAIDNAEAAKALHDTAGRVYSVWFGVAGQVEADQVADGGDDGIAGNGSATAYVAAPNGTLDMDALRAALSSIMDSAVAGPPIASAAPTVSQLGDDMVISTSEVRSCRKTACSLARPGHLHYYRSGTPAWDAGAILRSRLYTDRHVLSTEPAGGASAANDANCGLWATCGTQSAALAAVGSGTLTGTAAQLLRGDPSATFLNGAKLGDSDGDGVVDDPVKLGEIADSQAVIVGAPLGIGEEIDRWQAFRALSITRLPAFGGDGSSVLVKRRDVVVYAGSNDAQLHAFLAARDTGAPPAPGRSVRYGPIGRACAVSSSVAQSAQSDCDGVELWSYAPRLLQPRWGELRRGRAHTVDGTPAVSDVLFTKGRVGRGPICTSRTPSCTGWEYRTVLLECLGSGGVGCFALDVTNPFNPQLLWERTFAAYPQRATSTSRPVIARVKQNVGGTDIPYYVGLFGGGLGETSGSFFAVGLEDGRVYATSPGDGASASLASRPTCLDTDQDSFTDTCYAVATDASIWKVRLSGGSPLSMSMTKLFDGRAATGRTDLVGGAPLVATFDARGFLDLFYATGNFAASRSLGEQNFIFKVEDRTPAAFAAWTAADNASRISSTCGGAGGALPLAPGEKVLAEPRVSRGVVYFAGYLPGASECDPGTTRLHGLHHDTCDAGIDTNADGTPEATAVDAGPGQPTGLLTSEATGQLGVVLDDARPITPWRSPTAQSLPVSKLWWRSIFR